VIPAENLVAIFQGGPGRLLGVAGSAAEGQVLLEALEAGTAGVVLRTEDPLQVGSGRLRSLTGNRNCLFS
jgi:3-dehydroquinate synthase class II